MATLIFVIVVCSVSVGAGILFLREMIDAFKDGDEPGAMLLSLFVIFFFAFPALGIVNGIVGAFASASEAAP